MKLIQRKYEKIKNLKIMETISTKISCGYLDPKI